MTRNPARNRVTRLAALVSVLLLSGSLASCAGSNNAPAAGGSQTAESSEAADTSQSSGSPSDSPGTSQPPGTTETESPVETTDTAGGGLEAKQEAARALLPQEYVDSGKLIIATNLAYAPYSFKDEDGNPAGIDIDLMNNVTRILGLEPVYEEVAFPSIIPGIENGRYDVGVDEIADTAERRQAVSFVDYWKLEYGVVVGPGAPPDWIESSDICGRTFGQTNGSAQVALLDELGDKCEAQGEPRPDVSLFPDTGTTFLALENGRVQGYMSDKGNTVHRGKELGPKNFRALDGIIDGTQQLAGIAFNKNNEELGEAMAAAVRIMFEDGSYQEILEKYGLEESNGITVDQVGINGG